MPSAITLILAILHARPVFLITALLFCVCGDLFLAWSGELKRAQREPFFTIGIGAFGIAHVFLILYFRDFQFRKLIPAAVLIVLILITVKTGFLMSTASPIFSAEYSAFTLLIL